MAVEIPQNLMALQVSVMTTSWYGNGSGIIGHCEWNLPVTGGSPHKGPVVLSFEVPLLSARSHAAQQTVELPVIWDTVALV